MVAVVSDNDVDADRSISDVIWIDDFLLKEGTPIRNTLGRRVECNAFRKRRFLDTLRQANGGLRKGVKPVAWDPA